MNDETTWKKERGIKNYEQQNSEEEINEPVSYQNDIMNYYCARTDSNIQLLQLFHNWGNKTNLQCKMTLPVP
jgi:hypothetical protein